MDCKECEEIISLRSKLNAAIDKAKIKSSLIYSDRRVCEESIRRLPVISELIKSYISMQDEVGTLGCTQEAISKFRNKVNRKIKELECL